MKKQAKYSCVLNNVKKAFFLTFIILCVSCSTQSKQKSSHQKAKNKKTVVAKKTTSTKTTNKSQPSKKNTKFIVQQYAKKMQVDPSRLNPKLYTIIDSWIGVPYKYGGNSKKGVDCSAFVGQVYQNCYNGKIPRTTSELSKVITKKPKNKLKEGDLVFFNYKKRDSHVGIYLHNGWFVHASTIQGVTLSDLKTRHYISKFSKGGSVKTVSTGKSK